MRVANPDRDPQLQISALTAFGVDPRRIFVDYSAATAAAGSELARLLDQLQCGDALVVWRLDRLCGSLSRLLRIVADLGAQGVGFVSITEAVDNTPPAGRGQLRMISALAAFERDLRRERATASLAAAKALGRAPGRPTVMKGDKIAVAKRMLADGSPKAVIAKTIGVSRPTLYAHLPDFAPPPTQDAAPCQLTPRDRAR